MAVLNLTPDSFSDGGRFLEPSAALAHAKSLLQDGADVLDLGAESTRPGSTPVSLSEERNRLLPVLAILRDQLPRAILSVDTRKPELMLEAAAAGAHIVNDVEARRDPHLLRQLLAMNPELQYVAMHMHGTPETMQKNPLAGAAAVGAVAAFFAEEHARLVAAGFAPERIWLDPGVGFGKDDAGNAHLLRATARFAQQYNVAVGISRKGFLGRALDLPTPRERDTASKTLEFGLACAGARMLRTHEPKRLRRLLDAAGMGGR